MSADAILFGISMFILLGGWIPIALIIDAGIRLSRRVIRSISTWYESL